MILKDLFERNIEDHIAPVIFFNQKDPATIQKEVSEYVFTSSNTRSIERDKGIHEQLLKLLTGILKTIEKKENLPASWVSGFYGSGKSSLAKLIGLCLDDFRLQDGSLLVDSFFKRNDSGKVKELVDAYAGIKRLTNGKTFSIVFDIGASSKTEEHIPLVAYRELLKRLGYSSFESIAYYEILLEEEGRYPEFLELCKKTYSREWGEIKNERRAKDSFSHLYHLLKPEEYRDPQSWHITNFGRVKTSDDSIEKLVEDMKKCISMRMPGYTLFIVIDEVSQYIGTDSNRMLQLQSFTQEIGGKGNNQIWLVVTGQEKLEEAAKSSELFKLKDRFPSALRVYLEPTNVKEIIRRRLLKKKIAGREYLESLLTEGNLSKLKLYAYGEPLDFQKEEIIDFYPLLPSYIDLILQISNGIRNRSMAAQRDTGGVRSALQISHDILNEKHFDLKNQKAGGLVSVSHIFSIVSSSLDNDMKMTIPDIRKKCESEGTDFMYDVAKCIILLEYVEGIRPVNEESITKLLYPAIGSESISESVLEGIQFLEKHKFIQFKEESGWRLRGSISQEWEKEKSQIAIDLEKIEEHLHSILKTDILLRLGNFNLQELSFPYEFYKTDTEKLKGESSPNIKIQFVLLDGHKKDYIQISKNTISSNSQERRLFWCPEDMSGCQGIAREILSSRQMIGRYSGREAELDQTRKRLLLEEKTNQEILQRKLVQALEKSLHAGVLYCNGKKYEMSHSNQKLSEGLQRVVSDAVQEIFPQLGDGLFKITKMDLDDLLVDEILTSRKEFQEGVGCLGLLRRDQKKLLFTGSGTVPGKISNFCQSGKMGSAILTQFTGEPYGYSTDLVKLCLLVLVRAGHLEITGKSGEKYTSIRDLGFREIFTREGEFRNAIFFPFDEKKSLDPRSRNQCTLFFKNQLGITQIVANDIDSLADAVFKFFPPILNRIGELRKQLIALGLNLDPLLEETEKVIQICKNSRFAVDVVKSLYDNLIQLEAGVQKIKEFEYLLTDEIKAEIIQLKNVLKYEYNQLREIESHKELEESARKIEHQLGSNRPFSDLADLEGDVLKIKREYHKERKEIIQKKEEAYREEESQIKNRTIFSEITIDERALVLKPLQNSNKSLDSEAVAPTLLQIVKIINDIETAGKESHRLLDKCYNDSQTKEMIITISIPFLHNEINSIELLDAYLKSLRERCEAELIQGRIIRFQ